MFLFLTPAVEALHRKKEKLCLVQREHLQVAAWRVSHLLLWQKVIPYKRTMLNGTLSVPITPRIIGADSHAKGLGDVSYSVSCDQHIPDFLYNCRR